MSRKWHCSARRLCSPCRPWTPAPSTPRSGGRLKFLCCYPVFCQILSWKLQSCQFGMHGALIMCVASQRTSSAVCTSYTPFPTLLFLFSINFFIALFYSLNTGHWCSALLDTIGAYLFHKVPFLT
jgi:hypothetical protein